MQYFLKITMETIKVIYHHRSFRSLHIKYNCCHSVLASDTETAFQIDYSVPDLLID